MPNTKLTLEQSNKFHFRTAEVMYEDLNTPISLSCYLKLKYKSFDDIANGECDPINYEDALAFQKDYAAVSYLKKLEALPANIDKKQVALEKFLEAEQQNYDINERGFSDVSAKTSAVLFTARRIIRTVLGDLPKLKEIEWKFGPGATSSSKGCYTSIPDKITGRNECTIELAKVIRDEGIPDRLGDMLFHHLWTQGPTSPVNKQPLFLVNYNVLGFVPKTAKTDRAICVEPHLNTPVQRGYGLYIRSRLKKFGLDIQTQAGKNAYYARRGSIDDSYATIDLAMASDTISIAIVHELLPTEWFDRLTALQSPFTRLPDGEFHENEKFSSQGNGFTFELETLIFWALSRAVLELKQLEEGIAQHSDVMAYGDDIICPSYIATELVEQLTICGFKINSEKSFLTGPFRESCGKDYWLGIPVRPIFAKVTMTREAEKVTPINKVGVLMKRLCVASIAHTNCDYHYSSRSRYANLKRTWWSILKRIPKRLHCFGPEHLGDQVIAVAESSSLFKYELDGGLYRIEVLHPVSRSVDLNRYCSHSAYFHALSGGSSRVARRGLFDYKLKKRVPVGFYAGGLIIN